MELRLELTNGLVLSIQQSVIMPDRVILLVLDWVEGKTICSATVDKGFLIAFLRRLTDAT